jgi:CBS domain containing-hemolysin-like protein
VQTFGELIEQTLGRNPVVDDTIFIEPIEITVKETSLFKAKTVLIRTSTD